MQVNFAKHLKLNQLRLITAVVETGQLAAAADALAITQPAASRMLAEIERTIGARVFVRHARGMELTPVGQAIARRAHNSLAELNALSREVEQLKDGGTGVTRMGAVTGAAVGFVIPALNRFREQAPNAEVDLDVDTSERLVQSLLAGEADFVLARVPRSHDFSEFEIQPARTETVCFVVREDHPLARRRALSLRELTPYDWVMQSHRAPIREAVEAAILEAGAELPRGIVNTTSLLASIGLLTSSSAIAPMAGEVAELLLGPRVRARLATLELDRRIVMTPYYMLQIRDRQLSPLARQLQHFILDELQAGATDERH